MLVFSFCCWLLYIGACCELLFHNVAAAAVINVAAAAVNEVVGCCRWCCWSWLSKSQLVLVEVLCFVDALRGLSFSSRQRSWALLQSDGLGTLT